MHRDHPSCRGRAPQNVAKKQRIVRSCAEPWSAFEQHASRQRHRTDDRRKGSKRSESMHRTGAAGSGRNVSSRSSAGTVTLEDTGWPGDRRDAPGAGIERTVTARSGEGVALLWGGDVVRLFSASGRAMTQAAVACASPAPNGAIRSEPVADAPTGAVTHSPPAGSAAAAPVVPTDQSARDWTAPG